MKKRLLKVPPEIEYISEWNEYLLPLGHVVVDKGVTGCGYTEYCLRNNMNVILCSPRKLLLENKFDQHQGEPNIFYLQNNLKDYSDLGEIITAFNKHLLGCQLSKLPCKFLVTYDSAYILINFLQNINRLSQFYFVVDEFQSIFLDSYFKSEVENDFLEYLTICPNVLYVSATPYLDKYLELIPEFKDLEFQKLDWSESNFVENINIQRKRTNSLSRECKKIIESYLNGNFSIAQNTLGEFIKSEEVVFYFNSLTDITRIIKDLGLTTSQVDVICADTEENRKRLKKIKFNISKVPLKGEPHKMFTFCTRTVYIGADFYSNNASSYVFADPNIDCLALDISLDLPQIIGRQRDKTNPFKNNVVVFYKLLQDENIEDRAQFDKKQEERRKNSQSRLNLFLKGTDDEKVNFIKMLIDNIKVSKYSDNFVSISKKTGLPVYNHLIEIANERAWEVSQRDYQDSINVTKAIRNVGFSQSEYTSKDDLIITDFLQKNFNITGIFSEKLKLLCEFLDKFKDSAYITNQISHKVDPRYMTYYNAFGTLGCRAVSYAEVDLRQKLDYLANTNLVKENFIVNFPVGSRFTKKFFKQKISEIYSKLNIKRAPKATDILDYFEVKEILITISPGKRDKGYEILKIK